MPHSAAIIP